MSWVSAEMDYTALAGTVMAGEARLLSHDAYERLIQAKDIPTALRALQDTPYSGAADELMAVSELDSLAVTRQISRAVEPRLAEIISQGDDDPVVRLKVMEWEAHNLKIMLKYKFSLEGYIDSMFNAFRELKLEDVEESIYNYGFLEMGLEGISELKKYPLQDLHAHTRRPELARVVRRVSRKALKMEKEHMMASAEAILDLLVTESLIRVQSDIADEIADTFEEDRAFIKGYLARKIDIQNISLGVRKDYRGEGWDPSKYVLSGGTIPADAIRDMLRYDTPRFIEAIRERTPIYGKALQQWHDSGGGAASFTRMTRSLIDDYVRSGLFVFGPARVFTYMHWLENEYRTLRGVLVARLYGLSADEIRGVYGLGQ